MALIPDLPEILTTEKADCYYSHREHGFYDLNMEVLYKYGGKYRIAIGYCYILNGDIMRVPEFEIEVDLKKLKSEVLAYTDHHLGYYAEKEDEPLKENEFFAGWLSMVYANHGTIFPIDEIRRQKGKREKVFGNRKGPNNHDIEEEIEENEDIDWEPVEQQDVKKTEIISEEKPRFSFRNAVDNNMAILKTVVNILEENRSATIEEQNLLNSFRGLGTLRNLILSDDYPKDRELFWNLAERIGELAGVPLSEVHKQVDESLGNMYFTSPMVAQAIYSALDKSPTLSISKVLEPALGTGNMVRPYLSQGIEVTGVEMNFISAQISRLLYPSMEVVHSKYEDFHPENNFDLIISNVPFSKTTVFDKQWIREPEKDKFTKTLHGYYFVKSLDVMAEGGVLAFIAPTGIMDSPDHKTLRSYLMQHMDFITAVRLPNNTFENTEVTSDIIILQKRFKGEELSEETKLRNGLFVDSYKIKISNPADNSELDFPVSAWYLADPGKNNVLGTFTLGRMHGGFNLSVASNKEPGYSLIDNITDALSRGTEYIKYVDRNINQDFLKYHKGDNTPGDNLCQRNIEFLQKVRDTLSKDEILSGWREINKKYQSFSPEEKNHYRQLWGEIYNWAVAEYYPERTVVKFTDLVDRTYNQILDGQKSPQMENNFNQKIQALFNGTFIVPGKFPKELYTLSRLAQGDEQDREQVFPSVEFLAGVKRLFDDLEKVHELENALIDVDKDSPELSRYRQALNNHYRALAGEGGILSGTNVPLVNDYFSPQQYHDFLSLEEKNSEGRIVPADVFRSLQDRKGAAKYSDTDWLFKSLNLFGGVDNHYLEANAPGILERLQKETTIFRVPGSELYQTAERYLSGNVKQKLAEARKGLANGEKGLELNVRELEQIIPEDKSIQDIVEVVNLGERWIPIKYYNEFVREHLKIKAQIYYDKYGDQYFFEEDPNGRVDNAIGGWRLAAYWNADKILEKAFSHTTPFVTNKKEVTVNGVSKVVDVPDEKATKKGAMLIEKIRTEWKAFCISNHDFRDFLQKEYNDRFNNVVLPHFDGSALTFSDMVGKAPYPTQKNAVWRILQGLDGDGINDHYVGAGKSLVMSAAAHEMVRIGKAKKVLITGLIANVKDLYESHKELYPNDKVLYIDRKYGSSKRAEMLAKIRNGNWDVVFMPHTQFGMIPQDKEIVLNELNQQIDAIGEELQGQGTTLTKKQRKGLIDRKKNLEAVLQKRVEMMKKDMGLPTFKDLGFDYLLVDESHIFKNLGFATKHGNLAGLGNAQGSMRALNMLFACRTLQQKWKRDTGIAFFSGTPISNSLTEMYSLQRYLSPTRLQNMGLYSLDSWLATYGMISTEFEVNVAGTIAPKERLRGVLKADHLVQDYWMMADVVQKKDKNVVNNAPKPDAELVKLSPTPVQEVFNDLFLAFSLAKEPKDAEWLAPLLFDDSGKFIDEAYLKAKMVVVASMAKQASIHPGLRRSDMSDFYSQKIEAMSERVLQYYNETTEHKGTQIIFSNVGTPSDNNKDKAFTVYDCIRERLVQKGIPRKEIAFIHDFNTDSKRQRLFDAVNAGDVRVVIGSTEKLGTGVNIQEKVVCMHHMDIPWRPDEVEQRSGRGARQGNKLATLLYDNKVKNFFYATEKMLDVYQYNLLDLKKNVVDILHDPHTVGNIYKIDDQHDDGTPSYDEFVADLSGDNDMLKKVKLEKQIEDTEYKYRLFLDKKATLEDEIRKCNNKITGLQENLVEMEKEKMYLAGQMKQAEVETISDLKLETVFDLTHINKGRIKAETNDQIGAILLQVLNDNRKMGEHVICSYLGYDIIATREVINTGIAQVGATTSNNIKMRNKSTGLNYLMPAEAKRTERTAGLWIKGTLQGILSRPDDLQKRINRQHEIKDSYKAQLDAYPTRFEDAEKLPQMKIELSELTLKVRKNGQETLGVRIGNINSLKKRYANDPELFLEDMRALDAKTWEKAGIERIPDNDKDENCFISKENVSSNGIQMSIF